MGLNIEQSSFVALYEEKANTGVTDDAAGALSLSTYAHSSPVPAKEE